MKILKIGQVFNYNGLLWQVVRSKIDGCFECELFEYCVKEHSAGRGDCRCCELCSQPTPRIPYSGTVKLISKNDEARRKIRENAC